MLGIMLGRVKGESTVATPVLAVVTNIRFHSAHDQENLGGIPCR